MDDLALSTNNHTVNQFHLHETRIILADLTFSQLLSISWCLLVRYFYVAFVETKEVTLVQLEYGLHLSLTIITRMVGRSVLVGWL